MATFDVADYSGLRGTPCEFYSPRTIDSLEKFVRQRPHASFRIGAGLTGVSGGAVPLPEECYIDVSQLTRIEWYDQKSGIIRCECGTTMKELQAFVQNGGWEFPIIPGSSERATLGGMLACNGGGPLSLKYGKIGNTVLELEIMTASGERFEVGGKSNKVSQGIMDKSIWIGSEGTLGIIVSALLRCIPKLPDLHYYRIASDNMSNLMQSVPQWLQYDPYLLELASEDALKFSSKRTENVIWAAFSRPLNTDIFATSEFRITSEATSMLEERFQIGHNLQNYKPFVDLDVSFPVKHAALGISHLSKLLMDGSLEHIVFGHAGDGNYHIHVFFNGESDVDKWQNYLGAFDQVVLDLEGSISGEHGIGRVHRDRYRKCASKWQKTVYESLKKSLDPNNQFPSLF